MQIHTITTVDGGSFLLREFTADASAPVVQILHGMAEHCGRYERFARQLQQAGFSVWLHNHRGHGERLPAGHLQRGEWQCLLQDIFASQQQLGRGRRLVLLGHSMGSFIARDYLRQYPDSAAALILSGSHAENPFSFRIARHLAALIGLLRGNDVPSPLITRLSFGRFNRHVEQPRSAYDWLSRDPAVVDAYLHDPLCGFDCTPGFWQELLQALVRINTPPAFSALPPALPVLLIAGDQDPVGHRGKGMRQLEQWLRQGGVEQVSLKLYPGGRHEMLNEPDSACEDVIHWLQQQPGVLHL